MTRADYGRDLSVALRVHSHLPRTSSRNIVLQLLPILLVVALTVILLVHRQDLLALGNLGYAGIFSACLLSNSTVFIPSISPGLVLVASSIYSPALVALVGGLGSGLGEIVGYVIGMNSSHMVKTNEFTKKILDIFGANNSLVIFCFAFLPFPFDVVGFASGFLHVSFVRFVYATISGRILKMAVIAIIGECVISAL